MPSAPRPCPGGYELSTAHMGSCYQVGQESVAQSQYDEVTGMQCPEAQGHTQALARGKLC